VRHGRTLACLHELDVRRHGLASRRLKCCLLLEVVAVRQAERVLTGATHQFECLQRIGIKRGAELQSQVLKELAVMDGEAPRVFRRLSGLAQAAISRVSMAA